MELNFDTLEKILSRKSNELLNEFIDYIDWNCENYSLIEIVRKFDEYEGTKYHDLITSLSHDLKEYAVSDYAYDDLTDKGYDFLILYTQYRILDAHARDYNLAVFGQESGVIDL